MIASTQRSGSSYLCHLLRETKAFGRPGEIYGKEPAIKKFSEKRRIDPESMKQLTSALRSEWTSSNGVFGIKVHYHQLEWLMSRVALSKLFPNPKFIYIDRNDIVMQAVSLMKARLTGAWSSAHTQKSFCDSFDYREFKDALNFIVNERNMWHVFFSVCEMPHLHITYEDLESSPKNEIARIADFLGVHVELENLDPDNVSIAKQRDEISDLWYEMAILESKRELLG